MKLSKEPVNERCPYCNSYGKLKDKLCSVCGKNKKILPKNPERVYLKLVKPGIGFFGFIDILFYFSMFLLIILWLSS